MILDKLLENIETVLNRISLRKLDAYALTQNRLHEADISQDFVYRRTYSGFYRVRLPIRQAYDTYFNLIEFNKNREAISLESILNELHAVTGRIETSFGSKLLATVNPNVAPLDSIVLGHLDLALPINSKKPNQERVRECVNIHSQLVQKMNLLIKKPQFQLLKKAFLKKFPGYSFTDVKILDLLLWQYRP